jgi:heme-degrading monooxygenase HmoA
MFVVLNRFKVLPEAEAAFRNRWLDRDITLTAVSGFVMIQFLRGEAAEDHIAYASQTVWETRQAYEDWRASDAFRQAHGAVTPGEAPLTLERRQTGYYDVLKTIAGENPPRSGEGDRA